MLRTSAYLPYTVQQGAVHRRKNSGPHSLTRFWSCDVCRVCDHTRFQSTKFVRLLLSGVVCRSFDRNSPDSKKKTESQTVSKTSDSKASPFLLCVRAIQSCSRLMFLHICAVGYADALLRPLFFFGGFFPQFKRFLFEFPALPMQDPVNCAVHAAFD
jgi:hypothetical protein